MDEKEKSEAKPPVQGLGAITNFLGGDSGQKLVMALVVLSGGGNLLNTSNAAKSDQEEIRRAVTEVHELHEALSPMLDRQVQMAKDVAAIKQHELPDQK